MKWTSRFRCALICLGFVAIFSGFSFRLIYLQMVKHDEYAELAAEKHVHRQIIHAERGSIVDANKDMLADNVPVQTVTVDATHINNADAAVDLLSRELKIPAAELNDKVRGERRYAVIKREVPATVAEDLRTKFRAQNLRGIYCDPDSTRVYPNAAMLCHVIGFTDFDHHGIQGVE